MDVTKLELKLNDFVGGELTIVTGIHSFVTLHNVLLVLFYVHNIEVEWVIR